MLTSLLNFILNNQIILEETPPIPTNFSPTHFCYQGEYLIRRFFFLPGAVIAHLLINLTSKFYREILNIW